MISEEQSIPKKSRGYRLAEDIFYVQFNDIRFFIEDDEQENFFYCILKNLFPDIRITKIFPLGGKNEVVKQSKKNKNNPQKIYLVDKDFDDVLNNVIEVSNLFYLDRYSIENYLIEETAIVEYVIGEAPQKDRDTIVENVDANSWIEQIGEKTCSLIYLHMLVQCKELGIENVGMGHERFIKYCGGFKIDEEEFRKYEQQIEKELKDIDGRLTIRAQLQKIKNRVKIDCIAQYLVQVPGKYLTKMVKRIVENKFNLNQRPIESFNYRLAEKCSFESLLFLKNDIKNYLK